MKKLVLSIVLAFLIGFSFGQTLNKGNLLGIHTLQFELQEGVTMEQLEDFLVNKYAPAFNEAFEGMSMSVIKGERGEKKDKLGIIYYMESDKIRNKYWTKEGVMSELGQASADKLQPLQDELGKLSTITGDSYTDWIVQ